MRLSANTADAKRCTAGGDVRPSGMDEFMTTTGSGAVSTEPDAMRVSVAVEASAPTDAEALATVVEAAGRAVEVAPSSMASKSRQIRADRGMSGRSGERSARPGHRLTLPNTPGYS